MPRPEGEGCSRQSSNFLTVPARFKSRPTGGRRCPPRRDASRPIESQTNATCARRCGRLVRHAAANRCTGATRSSSADREPARSFSFPDSDRSDSDGATGRPTCRSPTRVRTDPSRDRVATRVRSRLETSRPRPPSLRVVRAPRDHRRQEGCGWSPRRSFEGRNALYPMMPLRPKMPLHRRRVGQRCRLPRRPGGAWPPRTRLHRTPPPYPLRPPTAQAGPPSREASRGRR
jgi:hypothetical protein